MCVFKNHAFIYFLRPPSWSGTLVACGKCFIAWWAVWNLGMHSVAWWTEPGQEAKDCENRLKNFLKCRNIDKFNVKKQFQTYQINYWLHFSCQMIFELSSTVDGMEKSMAFDVSLYEDNTSCFRFRSPWVKQNSFVHITFFKNLLVTCPFWKGTISPVTLPPPTP